MLSEVEEALADFCLDDFGASQPKAADPKARISQMSKRVRLNPEPEIKENLNSKQMTQQNSKSKELSNLKVKTLDKSNFNVIEKTRAKVNRAAHASFKPTKGKDGENVKKHFGTWKYFVSKSGVGEEKQKFYIGNDCRKVPEKLGYSIAKQEDQGWKAHCDVMRQIQAVGFRTKEPDRLEYWGLPDGICEQLYKHTGIKKLFPWQAECLSMSPLVQ